jgi:hypothetical protein
VKVSTPVSGLFSSCAMPAASWPIDASFSPCAISASAARSARVRSVHFLLQRLHQLLELVHRCLQRIRSSG